MRRVILGTTTAMLLLFAQPAHASATKTFAPPWTSASASEYCLFPEFPVLVEVGDCVTSNDTDAATGRVVHHIDVSGDRRATLDSKFFFENAYDRGGTSLQVEATLDLAELSSTSNSRTEIFYDISMAECDCHGGMYLLLQDGQASRSDETVTVTGTLTPASGGALPTGTVHVGVWISSHVVSSQAVGTDSFVLDATLSQISETRTH